MSNWVRWWWVGDSRWACQGTKILCPPQFPPVLTEELRDWAAAQLHAVKKVENTLKDAEWEAEKRQRVVDLHITTLYQAYQHFFYITCMRVAFAFLRIHEVKPLNQHPSWGDCSTRAYFTMCFL